MAKNAEKKENVRKTRTNEEIFGDKMNRMGGIISRQIGNLRKTQKNAIKSGNVDMYNKFIHRISDLITGLEIDETTIEPETQKEFSFEEFIKETPETPNEE